MSCREGRRPLAEIWHGEAFHQLRPHMRRLAVEGERWLQRPDTEPPLTQVCARGHGKGCFMRNFYYWTDGPLVRRLDSSIAGMRNPSAHSATA